MREEILFNVQIALFFKVLIDRPDYLAQSLNNSLDNIFDQIPIILPLPNDPQFLEAPVVQLNSSNGVYACHIARGRVDFFIAGQGRQRFSDVKDEFEVKVEKLMKLLDKNTMKRIGFVTRFFFEDEKQNETIAKLINDKFKSLHRGKVQETFVKYVTREKVADMEINNFISIEKFSARISGIEGDAHGILVTRDFNSVPEVDYSGILNVGSLKKLMSFGQEKFQLPEIVKILYGRE